MLKVVNDEPLQLLAQTLRGNRHGITHSSGCLSSRYHPGVPGWQRDWILAASWPPWFTISLWEWAQTLRWPTQVVEKGDSKGVTYVELVANYVAVTKLMSKSVRQGERPTDLAASATSRRASQMLSGNLRGYQDRSCCRTGKERCSD